MLEWAAPSGRTVAFLHLRVRVCEAGREDRSPVSPRVGLAFLLRGAMSLPLGHSVSRVLLRRLCFAFQVKKGCRVGRAGRLRAFLSNPLNNLGLPRAPRRQLVLQGTGDSPGKRWHSLPSPLGAAGGWLSLRPGAHARRGERSRTRAPAPAAGSLALSGGRVGLARSRGGLGVSKGKQEAVTRGLPVPNGISARWVRGHFLPREESGMPQGEAPPTQIKCHP